MRLACELQETASKRIVDGIWSFRSLSNVGQLSDGVAGQFKEVRYDRSSFVSRRHRSWFPFQPPSSFAAIHWSAVVVGVDDSATLWVVELAIEKGTGLAAEKGTGR